jgi:4'-phosphopantetheinyl transferase
MWWLAAGDDEIPAGPGWLSPGEAARAERLRYPKRHAEYLLRRWVAKRAVAALLGRRDDDPAALAAIGIANAPGGAPYVLVDGARAGLVVSLTDRAGWAVCVVGRAPDGGAVGYAFASAASPSGA